MIHPDARLAARNPPRFQTVINLIIFYNIDINPSVYRLWETVYCEAAHMIVPMAAYAQFGYSYPPASQVFYLLFTFVENPSFYADMCCNLYIIEALITAFRQTDIGTNSTLVECCLCLSFCRNHYSNQYINIYLTRTIWIHSLTAVHFNYKRDLRHKIELKNKTWAMNQLCFFIR